MIRYDSSGTGHEVATSACAASEPRSSEARVGRVQRRSARVKEEQQEQRQSGTR